MWNHYPIFATSHYIPEFRPAYSDIVKSIHIHVNLSAAELFAPSFKSFEGKIAMQFLASNDGKYYYLRKNRHLQ